MRSASSGRPVSAASSRAASHHAAPSSPAISRKRPGVTRSLIGRRLPSSSSIQACGSGAPGRVDGSIDADVVDVLRRRAAVGHDGGGVVGEPVLDVELGELHRLRAELAHHVPAKLLVLRAPAPQPPQQRHVLLGRVVGRDADQATDLEVVEAVLQRALAVALVDRAPLGLVGLEQRRRRVAREDRGELPAQVLGVVDRARQPEAAGRRVAVGGVAEQEHASDLEASPRGRPRASSA